MERKTANAYGGTGGLSPAMAIRHFVPVALCLIAENGEGEGEQRREERAEVAFLPVALCLIAENGEGDSDTRGTFMPVALCVIADNSEERETETATEAVTKRARAA
jgi:hypothetical protein